MAEQHPQSVTGQPESPLIGVPVEQQGHAYTDIGRSMRKPHGTGLIGDVDTLIAATAVERGLTVVTADSDFTRVPGIAVQLVSVR